MTTALLLAVLPGLATAATTTGAGASPKSSDVLVDGYRTTLAAGSAKETIAETVSTSGRTVTVSGSGAEKTTGTQDGYFTFGVDGISFEERIIGSVLYMKLPASSLSELDVSTPWVSLNLTTVVKEKLGTSYQSLVDDGNQGPKQSLAVLAASSDGVHRVGQVSLDGVTTTEYRANVNLEKEVRAEGKSDLAPVIADLESTYHLSTIPVTVWIDGRHRVRQLHESFSIPATGSSPAASFSATVGISDFGTPVSVTAPPSGQVTDITARATAEASQTS